MIGIIEVVVALLIAVLLPLHLIKQYENDKINIYMTAIVVSLILLGDFIVCLQLFT